MATSKIIIIAIRIVGSIVLFLVSIDSKILRISDCSAISLRRIRALQVFKESEMPLPLQGDFSILNAHRFISLPLIWLGELLQETVGVWYYLGQFLILLPSLQ